MTTGLYPTYFETELRALPVGAPVVIYGRQVSFYITHGGREILGRGTFEKVGRSKLDGRTYAFWREATGFKKMSISAAVHQIGCDKI